MKKILVSRKNDTTQIFTLHDGEPESFYTEQDENFRLVGNIYKGVVQNLLPAMNAAFVDIGRERNAFLQFGAKENIHAGQSVLIQIEKDATDIKGPRATLNISLPASKIVLMPTVGYIGLSQKIPRDEKERLHRLIKKIRPKNMGVIVRTAAQNSTADELAAEFAEPLKIWAHILERSQKRKPPALLYSDNDLILRIMREEFGGEVEIFLTDSVKIYRHAMELAEKNFPLQVGKIQLYEGAKSLFESFGVDEEIKNLSKRELHLPSGGFIVIEKTEALTAIDVNTGSFVGEKNFSETIFQTNIEAAELILKQLRLRNIGGIIIVDFIDMQNSVHRENLMKHLREVSKLDRSKTTIVDMTPLGLVEITRQAARRS